MTTRFINSAPDYIGLSTDTKPVAATSTVKIGSTFYEYNTKKTYITYDGTNWTRLS